MKDQKKNKETISPNIPGSTTNKKPAFGTLVEGAFIVMIGQNALLISKPFISLFMGKLSIIDFLLIIAIGTINTINIIFIWISSKENADNYSAKYFVWDVITLVLLFSLTQICIDAFEDDIFKISIYNVVLIFSAAYIIIYLGYIFWNIEEIRLNDIKGTEKKKIYFLNTYIVLYIISLVVLLVASSLRIELFMHISFVTSMTIASFIFFIFCKNYVK